MWISVYTCACTDVMHVCLWMPAYMCLDMCTDMCTDICTGWRSNEPSLADAAEYLLFGTSGAS